MGDKNPIRTLGDYSKPSHDGYKNTIELPSEDLNQHLKDFLKLVDSLDLDGENRERTRLLLFQFSLHDQARNWLERLPAGSITTWEDLTTRFLPLFFPSGRTAKLHNDILMFQQHHEESLSEAWTRFKDLLQKVPHHGIDLWLQYCMEDLEQAFVEYASSRIDEAGEGLVSNFMASQDARLTKFEAYFKQQQSEMTNKINTVLKAITDQIAGALPSDTVKNPKLTEEEMQEREGDPEDTNTIAYIEERRDTPLLERKDITAVSNLGSNKDYKGIEILYMENNLVNKLQEFFIHNKRKMSLHRMWRLASTISHASPSSRTLDNGVSGILTGSIATSYCGVIGAHSERSRRVIFDEKKLETLGWHLEEIHVTWAHLEKKRTRLRLYTIYLEELYIQSVETASQTSSDESEDSCNALETLFVAVGVLATLNLDFESTEVALKFLDFAAMGVVNKDLFTLESLDKA
ncbi:zinc finger, CCHC-type containing protein [Tanacetum coccineum]